MCALLAPGASAFVPDLPSLDEVIERFQDIITRHRLLPGAALAVYRDGRLVLDIVAGWADTQRAVPVAADSLFLLFSGTKPLVAVALLQQVDLGKVSLDDPVARYWPDFARNGKERVTIRHILTHTGGFPTTPPGLDPARWHDLAAATSMVASMPLEWPAGSATSYHFVTQHWVIAELVRRLDAAHRPIDRYVREEITGPLGMSDTWIGMPRDQEHRLARLHVTDGADPWGIEALRGMQAAPMQRWVVPGASGVSSARDMARFYAVIAAGGALDGVRILREETVDLLMQPFVDGMMDIWNEVPVRRGLGFELGGLDEPKRQWPGATSTARTVWHGGFGSSVFWGDRAEPGESSGLAFAFLSNGVRRDMAVAIARRDLSDAVRMAMRSLGGPGTTGAGEASRCAPA